MINTVFSRMDTYQRHGTNANMLDLKKVESRLTANNTLDKSLFKKNEEVKDDASQASSTNERVSQT